MPRDEFAARVDAARELAARRGLDGLVVASRGGGPFERHGDVAYLTGHYTTFPAIPDRPPHWRMRGHAAAVVGAGRIVLVTDDDAGSVAADEVRHTHDLPRAIAEAVHDCGIAGRRLGFVGRDAVSGHHLELVAEAAGSLVAADRLLAPLRMVKSPAEQDLLRRAGEVGGAAIAAAIEAVLDGSSEQEAAAAAAATAMARGAAFLNAFTVLSGPDRPPRRRQYPSYADDVAPRSGEVFAIDLSGALDGYLFDVSRSCVLGADRHGGRQAIADAREVVRETVDLLRAGRILAEAVAGGLATMRRQGQPGLAGEFRALGHGLGLGFEDPWLVEDEPTELVPGMCLAVERFAVRGPVVAAFEHNVLVTDGAPELLDGAPHDW